MHKVNTCFVLFLLYYNIHYFVISIFKRAMVNVLSIKSDVLLFGFEQFSVCQWWTLNHIFPFHFQLYPVSGHWCVCMCMCVQACVYIVFRCLDTCKSVRVWRLISSSIGSHLKLEITDSSKPDDQKVLRSFFHAGCECLPLHLDFLWTLCIQMYVASSLLTELFLHYPEVLFWDYGEDNRCTPAKVS